MDRGGLYCRWRAGSERLDFSMFGTIDLENTLLKEGSKDSIYECAKKNQLKVALSFDPRRQNLELVKLDQVLISLVREFVSVQVLEVHAKDDRSNSFL